MDVTKQKKVTLLSSKRQQNDENNMDAASVVVVRGKPSNKRRRLDDPPTTATVAQDDDYPESVGIKQQVATTKQQQQSKIKSVETFNDVKCDDDCATAAAATTTTVPSVSTTARDRIVDDGASLTTSSSSSLYVPKPPPTAEQVADRLLHQQPNRTTKAKKMDKGSRVAAAVAVATAALPSPPKPPPPTPATDDLLLSSPRSIPLPPLSSSSSSSVISAATTKTTTSNKIQPARTTKTTTTNHHRRRQGGRRRHFVLFAIRLVVVFVCISVMIKVTVGYYLVPYQGWLRDIRTTVLLKPPTIATMKVLRNWIPLFRFGSRFPTSSAAARIYPHVQPPSHVDGTEPHHEILANLTLRDFLNNDEGFHLALAPAFFGIYAYVGTFMAWEDNNNGNDEGKTMYVNNIKSVVGASAGAMAAVILAAGIDFRRVADLGNNMTLAKFADPSLGIGGLFKGDKFEDIMDTFLRTEKPNSTLQMEDSDIPVAVTVFDVKTLQGRILTRGSMARAARASATFPLLFQPVYYDNGILIDGGITDMLGLQGLVAWNDGTTTATMPPTARVVNVAVGGYSFRPPPGPQSMPEGVRAKEVLSVSILNTPQCGPWAMANGPRAMEAARRAMLESLDLPLYYGMEEGHYELHIDAGSFVD